MPQVLTTRTVETIKPSPSRKEIPDRYLPGLYLIVQPSGRRGWAVRYKIGRRSRKHTLGSYPAIDLKSARELAAKAFRAVAEGRDPGYEKVLTRSANSDTVGVVAELFFERHVKRVNRPRTTRAPASYSICTCCRAGITGCSRTSAAAMCSACSTTW
jgi:Arm DNA-binding domain